MKIPPILITSSNFEICPRLVSINWFPFLWENPELPISRYEYLYNYIIFFIHHFKKNKNAIKPNKTAKNMIKLKL